MNENRDVSLNADDAALTAECHLDFHKASGNGGQKVNKTSSAVRLFHIPSGITVTCAESRSQSENRHQALKKLRMRLALELRCPPGIPPEFDPPPSLSNPRYPLWTARLFDYLEQQEYRLKECADVLHTTRSKLTRLLERDPKLLQESRRRYAARNPKDASHENA